MDTAFIHSKIDKALSLSIHETFWATHEILGHLVVQVQAGLVKVGAGQIHFTHVVILGTKT